MSHLTSKIVRGPVQSAAVTVRWGDETEYRRFVSRPVRTRKHVRVTADPAKRRVYLVVGRWRLRMNEVAR